MSRLLHAITGPETPPVARAGLRGRPLERVAAHGLAVWTTTLDEASMVLERADLLEHHDIVCWIHERVEACLPARFPTWLPPDGLRSCDRFAAALDHVRGRSEIVLTAVWNAQEDVEPEAEAPMSGTEFLRRRQRALTASDHRRRLASQLAADVEQWAGPALVEARHQLVPSSKVALSSSLLVPKMDVEVIRSSLLRAQPDVRILVNGPWPPYTFAVIVRPDPQDESALREA